MKKLTFIYSFLAITLCVAVGSAQTRIKVFICPAQTSGSQQATLELRRTSASAELQTLDVIAGQPIKVHISPGNTNGYFTNDYSLTITEIKTTPTACGTGNALAPRGAHRGIQGTVVFNSSDPAINTNPGWKGTCRLLSVSLRNSTEFRGRIRFN